MPLEVLIQVSIRKLGLERLFLMLYVHAHSVLKSQEVPHMGVFLALRNECVYAHSCRVASQR